MSYKKFAFSGRFGSGKTTGATMVMDLLPNTVILSFASEIKLIATKYFGMDPLKKDRHLLQQIGQKFREIDPDIWVKILLSKIPVDKNVVIDDLRMPNEYTALLENGFTIIRLNVQPSVQLERLKRIYPSNWEDHIKRLGARYRGVTSTLSI